MPPRLGWRLGALLLPLATGILGLINGLGDWRQAHTVLQQVAALGVIAYGPLGLLAAAALGAGHRWWRPLLRAWAATLIVTGGVSPAAWGEMPVEVTLRVGVSMALMGLVAALSTALFCFLTFWLANVAFAAPAPEQ
ncbi:MAG TPA: hypothetical protein VFI13_13385 [Gemmatimonadales bacterium]|nr:hypothetical protein [Gemmatimonadales bacterium]